MAIKAVFKVCQKAGGDGLSYYCLKVLTRVAGKLVEAMVLCLCRQIGTTTRTEDVRVNSLLRVVADSTPGN